MLSPWLLVFLAAGGCHAVTFNTKTVQGSTCLHHLETSMPMQFDKGELAEFVMRSTAVHITKHGVRFVLPVHNIREGGMHGTCAA